MKTKSFNKSAGQMSRIILVLAGVVLLITVIVFIAIKIAGSKKSEALPLDNSTVDDEPPKPVYEATIGDIKFMIQSSLNMGSVLKSSTSNQQDLTTTERFIKVTIVAQNKGKNETTSFVWDIGNIIDSEGRNFIPITNKAYYFLPKPDLCGSILKPEFTPVPCVRIYEVSKQSKGLKVEVISKTLKQSSLLDLNLPVN